MGGDTLDFKKCSSCKRRLHLINFYNSKTSLDSKRSQCKYCEKLRREEVRLLNPAKEYEMQREGNLRRKYGLSLADYKQLLYDQGGCCRICEKYLDEVSTSKVHIDHDHTTGEVRGILCVTCNTGLGKFKDDPELLERARDYLEDYGTYDDD